MDNVASVQKIKMPIVVSHSPNDGIIPFSLGKKVYTAANQPKLFIELTGGHNDGFEKSFLNYTSQLEEFFKLNKVLN